MRVHIEVGHFGLEQALYLAASLLAVGPFLLRDLRKTRRRITLREDGLRVSNGGTAFLPWEELVEITVREDSFSSGSLVVRGKQSRRVAIPLKIRGCGELLFLLSIRSETRITYGHGY